MPGACVNRVEQVFLLARLRGIDDFDTWDETPTVFGASEGHSLGSGANHDPSNGGLDCEGATTPRLHDHGKARGADQSRAVTQLRRLDLRCTMALLLLLTGAKDD